MEIKPNNEQNKLSQTVWMISGTKCWVEIAEKDKKEKAFNLCQIIKYEQNSDMVEIKYITGHGATKIPIEGALQKGEEFQEHGGYTDLVDLPCLNDAELLYNIEQRYLQRNIYTFVGPSLLAVNPYETCENATGEHIMKQYHDCLKNNARDINALPTSVYAIATQIWSQLFDNHTNQSLIISGESGAGKTENIKFAMKFLTKVRMMAIPQALQQQQQQQQPLNSQRGKTPSVCDSVQVSTMSNMLTSGIEDQILSCNPILEAFGNAKTVRNDNSSRFGKYVQLFVDFDQRKIVGAETLNYLLEKSRIVSQALGERNYHIFYHLMIGASLVELESLHLTHNNQKVQMSTFQYLKQSECYDTQKINDSALYQEVKRSFDEMHFTTEEQNTIWRVLAAILWLGNVCFDGASLTNTMPCQVISKKELFLVSELLGIDVDSLSKALLFKTRTIAGDVINSPIKVEECVQTRDTFAKELYEKLFNWLVQRLNKTILPNSILELINAYNLSLSSSNANLKNDQSQQQTLLQENKEKMKANYSIIGLLDIFGFECFAKNSFEQLCINYTNEKLQQLFINYVFKKEQSVYEAEGLLEHFESLQFRDNQDLIDLMDKKPKGIFNLLDEHCQISSNDEKFRAALITKHDKGQSLHFKTSMHFRDTFIIVHTAREVEYTISGFLEKNKDELSQTIVQIFSNIQHPQLRVIYSEQFQAQAANKGSGQKYLGFKFRSQMQALMKELNSCQCHFIRCIKPNENKAKLQFNPPLALQQIRYMGVMDSLKVRKVGFPVRLTHRAFLRKYALIDPSLPLFETLERQKADYAHLANSLFQKYFLGFSKEQLLHGKTMLFMRPNAMFLVQQIYDSQMQRKHDMQIKIKNQWGRHKERQRILQELKIIHISLQRMVTIQRLWRGRQFRYILQNIRKKCILIQRFYRKKYYERKRKKTRRYLKIIQSYVNRYVETKNYIHYLQMVKRIQRFIRPHIMRRRLFKYVTMRAFFKNAILNKAWRLLLYKKAQLIQKWVRGFVVRMQNQDVVEKCKAARERARIYKGILTIQKHYRGQRVRKQLQTLNDAAWRIQGYMKMRWLRALFCRVRQSVNVIQRKVKSHLLYSANLKQRMAEYLRKAEDEARINKKNEMSFLFHEQVQVSRDQMAVNHVSQNAIKKISHFQKDRKMELFNYIVDIDFLTDVSIIYQPNWSVQYSNVFNENFKQDHPLQQIHVGDTCSFAFASNPKRVYSWGWNDFFQLGRSAQTQSNHQLNQSVSHSFRCLPALLNDDKIINNDRPLLFSQGSNHSFLMMSSGEVVCWGDNTKGQLGLGHNMQTQTINKFVINDNNTGMINSRSNHIKSVNCKGDFSIAIMEDGEAFMFPLVDKDGKTVFSPQKINFQHSRVLISNVALSLTFSLLLTNTGLVYGFGQNDEGQLGLTHSFYASEPSLLHSLQQNGDRVTQIECGFKHAICKNSLGRAYTWGWGGKGQLGHSNLFSQYEPKLIYIENRAQSKIKQVVAGYRHSAFLLDDGAVYWSGTNGTINQVCSFEPMDITVKNPNFDCKNFRVARLFSSWSKTMSTLQVTIADFRNTAIQSVNHQNKIFNSLIASWEQQHIHSILPPYNVQMEKILLSKLMPFQQKQIDQIQRQQQIVKKQNAIEFFPYPLMLDVNFQLVKIERLNRLANEKYLQQQLQQKLKNDLKNVKKQQLQPKLQQTSNSISEQSDDWSKSSLTIQSVNSDDSRKNLIANSLQIQPQQHGQQIPIQMQKFLIL